jgi:hypothetical protein
MAVTPQAQAIAIANQLIAIAQQTMSLYDQMTTIDQQWTDQGAAVIIAALGTVAQNTDGSLGTPDVTPNIAHPIDPAKFPTLSRSLSSNQIGQIKTILDGVVTYVNGQAVTTQVGARAILNVATGG